MALSFLEMYGRSRGEILFKPEIKHDEKKPRIFKLKLPELMERTSIDPRRSRNLPWFEDNRTSFQHNAEYLKRLSTLRDELIDTEEANLANALERLRQRQNISNMTTRGYRPRETNSFSAEPMPRKSLVTTSEHFKRTRPKRSPPRIMPLEGKQIVDPQTLFSKSPRSSHVSSNMSHTSDKDTGFNSATSSRTADDSFRLNLQRLIQPTSSIPNIGRKSTNSEKNLVLESSQLQKKSTSPKRSLYSPGPSERGSQFKGLHKGGGRLRQLAKPDDLELSPQTIHYDTPFDQDRLNLDQLKDYYCIYYLPPNTPIQHDEDMSLYDDSLHSGRRSEPDSSKKMMSAIEGRSILKPIDTKTGKSLSKLRKTRPDRDFKTHVQPSSSYCDSENSDETSSTMNKMRIVVDMPDTVFNSDTPSNNNNNDVDSERHHSTLRKTYKQNELRQRELKNLIEDVKELNMRNDTLSDFIHKSPGE